LSRGARIAYAAAMELLYEAHVPAGDGPHPTLLLLHGWGASAHDLLGFAPVLHGGKALVLCPQGPLAFQVGPGAVGFGWYPLVPDRPPEAEAVDAAREVIERFLDAALAAYPVDPRRVVIGGFSQGGFMACQIALRDPGRFAGLMALSSWLPSAFAEEVPRRPEHAELPTLVVHGIDDTMVPVERARDVRDVLLGLGVPTVYREYAMGHEIRPEALGALLEWLEEKVLSPVIV
jgi:phospholipase/carboxylesterase